MIFAPKFHKRQTISIRNSLAFTHVDANLGSAVPRVNQKIISFQKLFSMPFPIKIILIYLAKNIYRRPTRVIIT